MALLGQAGGDVGGSGVISTPALLTETMGTMLATLLAWEQVRVATVEELRGGIADIERFTGEVGELTHFIKASDKMHGWIVRRREQALINELDAERLKTALVPWVRVINVI